MSFHSMVVLQFQEHVLQGRVASDLLHGAGTNQSAVLDDGHPVTELFRHLQHVGGEENSTAGAAVLLHDLFQFMAGLGVQTDEGLVQQDELRLMGESRNQSQLLFHAVAESGDGLIQLTLQFQQAGVFLNALQTLLLTHAVDVADEIQIGRAGHEFIEVRVVRNVGKLLLSGQRLGADGLAADENVALVKVQDAAADLESRGLARTVVADEGAQLAGTDVQIQMVYGAFFAVALGQSLDLKHRDSSLLCINIAIHDGGFVNSAAHCCTKEGNSAYFAASGERTRFFCPPINDFEVIVMNPNLPSEKRRFAAAYLRCFDADAAAAAVGRCDGIRLLETPAVQRELELQRKQCDVGRRDVIRRLAQLAFGRANDCVRLVLEEAPDLDGLDLSLLSEVKRNEKGTVEVKLMDRIHALEQLLTVCSESADCAEAFFAAAEDVDEI